jgi:uncharacterized protein (DUF4415 family)
MKPESTSRKFKTDIEALRALKDSEILIDADAPAWTPEEFARAVLRKGFEPVPPKALLSLRIDADVLAWFRGQGRGYQSRMNALLRAYMDAAKEQEAKPPKAKPANSTTKAKRRPAKVDV